MDQPRTSLHEIFTPREKERDGVGGERVVGIPHILNEGGCRSWQRKCRFRGPTSRAAIRLWPRPPRHPTPSEHGTCKTVKARFWPWPSG